MRQKFNIGDLVRITHPDGKEGIILETMPINRFSPSSIQTDLHPDEYKCMIMFLESGKQHWVRAKWLKHLSKKGQ